MTDQPTSKDAELLARELGELLNDSQSSVTTAESCTGGGVAAAITSIPGSSAWFHEGFVCYSNEVKSRRLGVPKELLSYYGAVSQPVVRAMVVGALQLARADYAVAVSGIAGPDGGSDDKPVGTVWIASGKKGGVTQAQKFLFEGGRKDIRSASVIEALAQTIDMIKEGAASN